MIRWPWNAPIKPIKHPERFNANPTTPAESDPFPEMSPEYRELLRWAYITNPTVHAALDAHRFNGNTYQQALEAAVTALAQQNAELVERCTKLLSGAQTGQEVRD